MPADSGRARQTLSRVPSTVVHAPGRGLPARTMRASSAAGRVRVELELLDGELVGVGRLAGLRSRRACVGMAGQRVDEQLGAERRRAGPRSSPAVSSAPIGVHGARVHRPGVETGFELHEAHAGLGVAGEDRPLDRRRAPPARQQREVHVHEPARQRVEQRLREELAERDDDAELGAASAATSSITSRARSGVRTGSPSSTAAAFTGLGSARCPAAAAPVGLRDDERDLVPGVDQRAEGGTASAGVPKKTRRTERRRYRTRRAGARCGCVRPGVGRMPCSRSSRSASLRTSGSSAVEHQHAVEVVDLVQEHAAEQLVALEHDLVAVEVEAPHGDELGADDLEPVARAPRGSLLRRSTSPSRLDDLGVDRPRAGRRLVRS